MAKLLNHLTKGLKALSLIARNPQNLYHILHSNEEYRRRVLDTYGLSEGLPQLNLLDLLPHFSEKINYYSFLNGTASPLELAILKNLAKKVEDCTYFEIGTWRGESVSNVAEVAASCYSLNLSDAQLAEQGYNIDHISVQAFYSQDMPNITHLYGNSLTFDFSALGKTFDLIFIDGDHHYHVVKNDTHKVFDALVHSETVIVWHDYTRDADVWWEVLLGILDGMPEKHHRQLYAIKGTSCAIYLPYPIQTKVDKNPWQPENNYKVAIEASAIVKRP